jgi:hypothetical protein
MLEVEIDEAKRMANKITTITLATGVFLGCAVIKTPVVNSAPTLLGPTPYRFFVTWYGSIGGHKSTKSLSGKRFN